MSRRGILGVIVFKVWALRGVLKFTIMLYSIGNIAGRNSKTCVKEINWIIFGRTTAMSGFLKMDWVENSSVECAPAYRFSIQDRCAQSNQIRTECPEWGNEHE